MIKIDQLSVIRGPDGRITRVRYVLPRHRAATRVGPGRSRTSTRGWGELVPAHDDRAIFRASPAERPVIDLYSL